MKRTLSVLALLAAPVLLLAQSAAAPSDPEAAAIRQTALDYIEGWYAGDAARMERALHPELAKRIVNTDPPSGRNSLGQMSALTLIQGTRSGFGKKTPAERQIKEVTILDRFQNAASVKVIAADWIDYLHVAKWNGEWKIVNVLWERKAAEAPQKASVR